MVCYKYPSLDDVSDAGCIIDYPFAGTRHQPTSKFFAARPELRKTQFNPKNQVGSMHVPRVHARCVGPRPREDKGRNEDPASARSPDRSKILKINPVDSSPSDGFAMRCQGSQEFSEGVEINKYCVTANPDRACSPSHSSNPTSYSIAMKLFSLAALLTAVASTVNAIVVNTP